MSNTNRVNQFEGLQQGSRLVGRALVVVGRADVKHPALVVVWRVDDAERVGPAGDGLGSHLRRTARVAPGGQKRHACVRKLSPQTASLHTEGGGPKEEMPEKTARSSSSKETFKGNPSSTCRRDVSFPVVTVKAERGVDW